MTHLDFEGADPHRRSPERYRHKKRGGECEVIGRAFLQTDDKPLLDMTPMVVYRDQDGSMWVRSGLEFNDGRFERLPASPAPAMPGAESDYGKLLDEITDIANNYGEFIPYDTRDALRDARSAIAALVAERNQLRSDIEMHIAGELEAQSQRSKAEHFLLAAEAERDRFNALLIVEKAHYDKAEADLRAARSFLATPQPDPESLEGMALLRPDLARRAATEAGVENAKRAEPGGSVSGRATPEMIVAGSKACGPGWNMPPPIVETILTAALAASPAPAMQPAAKAAPGAESDAELVKRLRAGASKSKDYGQHLRKYQDLCDEAADRIAALVADNRRQADLIAERGEVIVARCNDLDKAHRLAGDMLQSQHKLERKTLLAESELAAARQQIAKARRWLDEDHWASSNAEHVTIDRDALAEALASLNPTDSQT